MYGHYIYCLISHMTKWAKELRSKEALYTSAIPVSLVLLTFWRWRHNRLRNVLWDPAIVTWACIRNHYMDYIHGYIHERSEKLSLLSWPLRHAQRNLVRWYKGARLWLHCIWNIGGQPSLHMVHGCAVSLCKMSLWWCQTTTSDSDVITALESRNVEWEHFLCSEHKGKTKYQLIHEIKSTTTPL